MAGPPSGSCCQGGGSLTGHGLTEPELWPGLPPPQGSMREGEHLGSSPPLIFLLSVTAFYWPNLPEGKLGKQLPIVQSRKGVRMNRRRHRRITGTEHKSIWATSQALLLKTDEGVFGL